MARRPLGRALLFATVGLLACCREAPAPPAPGTNVAEESRLAPDDLFGEWQVASLDSPRLTPVQAREIDSRSPIAILIGARRIEAASQCMPYLFEHRRGEARIEIESKGWPGPVCARMPMAYEGGFSGILEGVTLIEQSRSDEVRLSGEAGSVTLRRPEGGRLANPFGNSPAPGGKLLWGHFRVVEIGGAKLGPEAPIDVAIGRFWVEARSGCLPFGWSIAQSDASLTIRREAWPEPVCEQGLSEIEQALERAMPEVRSFEWIAPYRVRLVGTNGSVTLQRAGA